MLPDADIPAFHNRPPAQARAWDLICFSLPRDLENKCDWKASVSHLWLIKLPSLPSFLGAEQDEEQKRRNQPMVQRWVGKMNLDPIVLIAYGGKCLIFYQRVNKPDIFREQL